MVVAKHTTMLIWDRYSDFEARNGKRGVRERERESTVNTLEGRGRDGVGAQKGL